MNKAITIAMAAVLFIAGIFAGSKIGGQNTESMHLKSGTAMYVKPTACADYKMLPQNDDVTVLEKVKFGAPTMVYVNDDITAKAENGETYRLKKGCFFKFVGVNEAEDMVTLFVDTDNGNNIQLIVPKQKVYPVDEGQWIRVKDDSLGERWVRSQSSWYDNV